MSFTEVLLVAFIVSYFGSVPPGTINISVMQLSVANQRKAALLLGLAATLVEFVYAGATVKFQQFLSESPQLTVVFQIITATALVGIGIYNLFSKSDSKEFIKEDKLKGRTGFAKGLVLGFLNPMTIPFWLVVTNYLVTHNWVEVRGNNFWAYLSGLAAGTFVLLLTVDFLGSRFQKIADNNFIVHKVPGILFIGMGLYNAWKLF
jgi:threonine/homoserine/homoserine lactone efflux protein